jgi:hypothetical protein
MPQNSRAGIVRVAEIPLAVVEAGANVTEVAASFVERGIQICAATPTEGSAPR